MKVRILLSALLLAVVFGQGAFAKAAPAPTQPGLPGKPALPAAKGRITVDINSIDYNGVDDNGNHGMIVHMYLECGSLKGSDVRAGLFFFWDDDTYIAASADVPADSQTSDGALTIQDVYTPHYNESEWKDIPIFVPYSYLPTVDDTRNGYVIAVAGLDGQDFTRYGGRKYFTVNPG